MLYPELMTWARFGFQKSPFDKGGLRGIFNTLTKIPPPPFS